MNPQNQTVPASEFSQQLDPQDAVDTTEQLFDLELDDDKLLRITANQLDDDIAHWEQEPWLLTQTDKENIAYLLGIQQDGKVANTETQTPYVDNRLFTAVRAILAYATGQTAKPELLPSKSDDKYQTIAQQTGLGLYQHAQDHEVNQEMRLALKNLITRKRGYLKLRYDDDYGPYGDVCTENVDPADIVIGRFSRFQRNPDRIFHKQVATVQELCDDFPDAKDKIYAWAGIQRGVFTQVSRVVSYWECWFTYFDNDGEEAEGVCWFIPNSGFILGKMQNPNWLYDGSKKEQLIKNLTYCPVKPFIILNYWNTGRSAIDETCLFDQARPQQDILNKRGRQIVENADYANPRLLVNGGLFDEADAKKFVNKGPKTIGLLNNMDPDANINNAVMVINPTQLPSYVLEDKYDARNEIDTMMGTPTQFRGAMAQSKNPTLGQDLMVKNQASALQDDLVAVVTKAWRQYYLYLLQMMNVYLPDDYYVMTKGQNGEYNHIMLSSGNIDTNVRMSVRIDSTLPLDKESQRATAVQLAQMNRLDDLSLFELLGMPEPEKLAERKLRWEIDRLTYMQSIEQQLMSHEADQDIRLLINGKVPEDRDDYDEDYLNHFNMFITRNEFQKLPLPIQQRLTDFLHQVANKAAVTEGLRDSILNPAGIIDRPPLPPMPKQEVRYNVQSQVNSDQVPGIQPPQGGSPPAPAGQPSPPKMVNPSQFGVR
jgi:hypothetical protein